MSEKKYHCIECKKELSDNNVSLVRIQMMIDASYKLKTQNNKLLEFIKTISEEEPCPDDKWIWLAAKKLLEDLQTKEEQQK